MTTNIQHFGFYIRTHTAYIWGDVFATTEEQAKKIIFDFHPWLLSSEKHPTLGWVEKFVLEWEDNRPEETNTGLVNSHTQSIELTLDR